MDTYTELGKRLAELACRTIGDATTEILVALQDLELWGCTEINNNHSGNIIKAGLNIIPNPEDRMKYCREWLIKVNDKTSIRVVISE